VPSFQVSNKEGDVLENISRFYLKKKVIAGNTSKFIPPGAPSIPALPWQ